MVWEELRVGLGKDGKSGEAAVENNLEPGLQYGDESLTAPSKEFCKEEEVML